MPQNEICGRVRANETFRIASVSNIQCARIVFRNPVVHRHEQARPVCKKRKQVAVEQADHEVNQNARVTSAGAVFSASGTLIEQVRFRSFQSGMQKTDWENIDQKSVDRMRWPCHRGIQNR